ncbi:WASH complex subunit 4 [Pararge aegeria]|uniref:Jg13927 protein n=2 Tax=Pararge aegeria TaxID=116150 RepID=A0A8S4SEI8_9NEOP|nr:WASH complex subunit 4 [Pararge aegeria]CAH2263502.1 jg13927 [Pararge aegeria aegeria]
MKGDKDKEAGSYILRSYGEFFKKQYQDYVSLLGDEIKEENKTFSPIKVVLESQEYVPVTDLVASDNTVITKVLSVLTSLCIEVNDLKREAFQSHFKFLSVYDEYTGSDIATQVESICLLSTFLSRCNDTLNNLCSQFFAIFNEEIINLNGIQWHFVINKIGEIFTLIVILEMLISRCSLTSNWNNFYKNLKVYDTKPDDLGLGEEKFTALSGAVNIITVKLMNDDIVQSTLQNLLALRKTYLSVKYCPVVSSEITQYVKLAIMNLDKLAQDKPSGDNLYKCIKINALFVLNTHLFGNNDKKNFRSLMELNTKAHSIFVIGTAIWFPEQFLQRFVPALCGNYNKLSQAMLKARQAYMSSKKMTLTKDIISLQHICSQWALTVEEVFSSNNKLSAAEMTLHAKTILDGLDVASNINYSVLSLINLHLSLGMPLTKQMLMSMFEIMDILKSLWNAVSRNYDQIISSMNMIIQHLTFQAVSSILEIKKTLMSDKKYANKRLDELTCIVIAEQTIKGVSTLERNIATNIALSFVPETTYIEDTYVKLGLLLEKIRTLSDFPESIKKHCNCSWLLWHQNIIPIYFEQNFSMQLHAVKLKYFLMALDDCVILLEETDKHFGMNRASEFKNKLKVIFDEHVLKNISQNIETNLRLHIHSHLQLDIVDPLTYDMIKKMLLLLDNLRLHNVYMSVKPSVEHYLSKTCYNLTTVVLSDWKTYGEMRQMAKLKFKISTIQDNLPTQTLEQGLDVLEIMRNIHIFVSRYQYNLNNQIFIEKSSNNKHLNSINIRHIANSIRTHGTGIMNTTVNFTYQFLKNKFFIFSQFMYDEQIKSRLAKDLRNFKETAGENGNVYLYKNAEKFNKGIKVLGVVEDGQSYLDLFRDLISQIGNAMGYVRMIRSGGRHCCCDATAFLPNLEIKHFKRLCEENGVHEKTIQTADNLEENINDLITNFIQGTEYFKLLVEVFAPVFRNPKNVHLKNFFIIVPPLTLNFVEHMILSKDKMSKKNKAGAAFTDDGFAMGIAYILKLLDQDSSFESLHWFESVWAHIKKERESIDEQKSKGSVQLQQALALTEKKIKTLEEEYKLLYYSLTSARIFFR